MTTRTLLQMTQEILTSMQSDEVSSINDTAEATAVATCVQRTYWDLFGVEDLPEHYTMFQLVESSSATPTVMTLPANCSRVSWVKYNVRTIDDDEDMFHEVLPLDVKVFVDKMYLLSDDASNSNVSTYSKIFNRTGTDAIKIIYKTDIKPMYFMSPDQYTLVFDAVDTGVETFLRATKSVAYGLLEPAFSLTDGFTPDLTTGQFAMLFNEAKAQAFIELKQTQNAKAEARARRLMITAQKTRNRTPGKSPLDRTPNYGRR